MCTHILDWCAFALDGVKIDEGGRGYPERDRGEEEEGEEGLRQQFYEVRKSHNNSGNSK